jgi:dihydrodipicolinate synthase/N-acetylneuraminate lyase
MTIQKPIDLHGVITPLVTPFDQHNHIDFSALCQVVDFVIAGGVQAVMVGGTTGEGMMLSLDERKALAESVVRQASGRVKVIIHTGCIDTGSTVELTKHACATGADIVSAITPYFFTFNDEQLFHHFVSVAEAAQDTPVLLYVFPGNAKNDISPALLARLLKAAPNIAGIKSSNDDLVRFQDYVKVGGEDFVPCFGVDELMLGGLVFGSKAQISGNSNSFPEPFVALYQAFQAGEYQRAQELQEKVNSIVALHHAGATIAYFKATLKQRGIPAGRVRPPMRELTEDEMQEVIREAKRNRLLE